MSFKPSRFLVAMVLSVVAGFVVLASLSAFGVIPPLRPGGVSGDNDDLIAQAASALEAVRTRQPGDRRPASYDSVLAPLDALLERTRALVEGPSFDPVADFDQVRALAVPIMDIATRADRQARQETGFLAKEYRFTSQKGEAAQYLATAMWERITRRLPDSSGFFADAPSYPPAEMNELRRLLDQGLEAAPDNPRLYYIRGVLNRAEGLFGPAARDLEHAVEYDKTYVAAWNTLGLVRISLREFDRAEEAMERARALALDAAKRFETEPGEEYTAILYNLANFHENLAAYYTRETRLNPTVEAQALMSRHATEARRYLEEFLRREPADSPDAKIAEAKLQNLGR